MGNTEQVLDHLREHRVGLGLVEGHQHSPGVRLEEFIPDEIVAACAPRISDPKLRRAIEGVNSARDLETLPLIWREPRSRYAAGGRNRAKGQWREPEEIGSAVRIRKP
jgi:hypothetical protein